MITLGDTVLDGGSLTKLQLITVILQVLFWFLCSKWRGDFCHFLLYKTEVL